MHSLIVEILFILLSVVITIIIFTIVMGILNKTINIVENATQLMINQYYTYYKQIIQNRTNTNIYNNDNDTTNNLNNTS